MPQACAGGRGEERLAMLRELAEIGMRLARGVAAQAEAEAAAEEGPGDFGLVYSRIARAVRQTLALEARLEDELAGRRRQETSERERQRSQAAYAPVAARSRQVRRAVLRAIEADAEDQESAEALSECLDERLGDREADDDFLDRPMGELVALICKDLDVPFDPRLWEDEAWARAEAEARKPTPTRPPADPPSGPAPAAAIVATPPPPAAEPAAAPIAAGTPNWLSG